MRVMTIVRFGVGTRDSEALSLSTLACGSAPHQCGCQCQCQCQDCASW